MSESQTIATSVDYRTVSETLYDAVVIGSGVAGSIVAKELSEQGYRVLILEAGPAMDMTPAGFNQYVTHFHSSVEKDNNAPFPKNPNARVRGALIPVSYCLDSPTHRGILCSKARWHWTAPIRGSLAVRPCISSPLRCA